MSGSWVAPATPFSVDWYVAVRVLVAGAPELPREFALVPLGTGHNDLASDHYRSVFWNAPHAQGAGAMRIG